MGNQVETTVSVIIPTRYRPQLVTRAIASALAQTLNAFEVVVVVDGPDPETVDAVKQIDDPRLRVVELPVNVRLAGARNAGVEAAKGTWVAFLDDDDEWFPEKLERQLAVAERSPYTCPLVATRFIAKTPKGDFTWPRRLPDAGEHLSEYLFVRSSLFQGEGQVLPSTLMARRDLLRRVPFENNKHEDYDWMLKVTVTEDAGVEFVPEPLAVWHYHTGTRQKRLSQINEWRRSLDWLHSAQHLVTRRAYAAFIVLNIAPPAAAERDWSAFWPLLSEAIRYGSPRLFDLLLYGAMWLIPLQVRHGVRALLAKNRPSSSDASNQQPLEASASP